MLFDKLKALIENSMKYGSYSQLVERYEADMQHAECELDEVYSELEETELDLEMLQDSVADAILYLVLALKDSKGY